MSVQNIALVGAAHSGKDTVASHLRGRYGYQSAAFADGLRDLIVAVDPMIGHHTTLADLIRSCGSFEAAYADHREPIRGQLLRLGDATRRVLGERVWVDHLTKRLAQPGPWVVTDVRTAAEHAEVTKLGFVTVKIVRPGAPRTRFAGHATEQYTQVAITDHAIVNDSTIEALHAEVDVLMGRLCERVA